MPFPDSINEHFAHTDIRADSWLERKLPPSCSPYVRLARLDRPIGTWLLLLPGLWSITAAGRGFQHFNLHDWYLVFLFVIGAFVMRAAGCVINDLWDRKIDSQVERTRLRPLASGEISTAKGFMFLALLLWAGLIILIQLTPTAIFLGAMSVFLIVIYPLAKRVTWYPQFVLGLTFNMGALMGWASVTGQLAWPALLLYIAGIFWTLGYDTIYAHQDKQDDAIIGIRSTALKFGEQSPQWVAGFYAVASFMILMAGILLHALWPFFVGWAASCFHLIIQIYLWNVNDPASSLSTFRSNRNYALLVWLAIALAFVHI